MRPTFGRIRSPFSEMIPNLPLRVFTCLSWPKVVKLMLAI